MKDEEIKNLMERLREYYANAFKCNIDHDADLCYDVCLSFGCDPADCHVDCDHGEGACKAVRAYLKLSDALACAEVYGEDSEEAAEKACEARRLLEEAGLRPPDL